MMGGLTPHPHCAAFRSAHPGPVEGWSAGQIQGYLDAVLADQADAGRVTSLEAREAAAWIEAGRAGDAAYTAGFALEAARAAARRLARTLLDHPHDPARAVAHLAGELAWSAGELGLDPGTVTALAERSCPSTDSEGDDR